jgi:flagellar basal-body rod protein FlgG
VFDSLYIGAAGMVAHQAAVDTIANNLANLSTVGFRRGIVSFSEVSSQLTPSSLAPAAELPQAAAAGGAGAIATTTLSMLPGSLETSDQPLDVAISGAGFFEVLRADGTPAYTRAGQLEVNSDGLLATSDGSPLASQIQVPPDAQNVAIGSDGTVTAVESGSSTPVQLGRIQLVSFANPAALVSAGDNLYTAPAEAGAAQPGTPGTSGLGHLQQGYLESSDVNMSQEMVSLLLAQRGFELSSRVVQTTDQLWSLTNGLVRS